MIVRCVEAFTGVAEAIIFCLLFETLFERKDNIPKYVYPIVYVALAVGVNMSFWLLGANLTNVACVFILAFSVTYLYKTNLRQKIAIPIIMIVFNVLSEMLVWYIISYLFDVTAMNGNENVELWILGAFSSKILMFILANLIRLRFKNKKLFNNGNYWLLFIVVFIPMVLTDHLLFNLTLIMYGTLTKFMAIGSAVGLMVSAFVILYLYEKITEQAETEHREQQYAQQIKSQSKHLDEILVMQNQLKSFRHDIKNHYIVLAGYFDNGDFEGGKSYIDKINGEISRKDVIDTGNIALDAIISTKKALAEEKNIIFESTVQIPEQLPIDAADICIVFGNSLDNAIEACEKIKNGERRIQLSVIYEDDSILCKVVNSIEAEKKITLKSTKKDKKKHGFGIENIKQALSKYNHVVKMDQTDKEFVFSFIIFNK